MTAKYSDITAAIRTGFGQDATHHSIVPPLCPSTNFRFEALETHPNYDYSRSHNPTRDMLGQAIATLEGGGHATITTSGMSAITGCLMAYVPAGGLVIAPHDCYGGTWRVLTMLSERGLFRVEFVDQTRHLDDALAARPDLLLVETPSNPLLALVDLEEACAKAHAAGTTVAVDNTFCSPLRQRPLAFGADVVLHSTTKFLNGHSDVVGGAIVSRDDEAAERVYTWTNAMGITAGSWDSWLTLRGLRTIESRIRTHDANAERIVEELVGHPAVEHVYYPGLPDHVGHEIAARQQSSFGSMVSFDLGSYERAAAFCAALEIFDIAESLGGVESLVAHPATMTHAALPPEVQKAAGITPGLLRLSVGIELGSDLDDDIRQALDAARG